MQTSKGRTIDVQPWTPIAPGTVLSASGSSPVYECGEYASVRLTIAATAIAGTNPTADFKIVTCDTATGTFRQIGTFSQITTAPTTLRTSLGGADLFVRLDWVLGGTTPSVTCSATGHVA
jgi:hypothetical protein